MGWGLDLKIADVDKGSALTTDNRCLTSVTEPLPYNDDIIITLPNGGCLATLARDSHSVRKRSYKVSIHER